MIQVRRALARDVAEIRTRWPRAELLGRPDGVQWWVASESGAVLGHASARLTPDGECILTSAWTEPKARGRGIQGRLIRARVRWARREGAGRVKTYTWGGNLPSMRALIRARFVPVSREWDGERSWISWVREL